MITDPLRDYVNRLEAIALSRYQRAYDNALYLRATSGLDNNEAVELQMDALALCGDPLCRFRNERLVLSLNKYTTEQIAFLMLFLKED